ncbi:hypothetical protein HDU97_001595 [Phlyctochytrium planicorne]|nr:hypothetical protein HDU97_001595 [Phlyctochytrium planicorne]
MSAPISVAKSVPSAAGLTPSAVLGSSPTDVEISASTRSTLPAAPPAVLDRMTSSERITRDRTMQLYQAHPVNSHDLAPFH